MIDSVHIQGFQSHKDSVLEFAPGVNAIIGVTSHGKTAVLRAIEWLRTNRPLGDAFINHSLPFTKVEIEVDGHTVIRYRDRKGKNYYKMDGERFEAMGSDVPACVEALFNFGPLNVQSQFDPYFLLYESPGKRAAFINETLRLDRAATMLDLLKKWGRDTERAKKEADTQTAELTEKLAAFPDLDAFEKQIEKYELITKERYGTETNSATLRDQAEQLVRIQRRLASEFDKVGFAEEGLDELERNAKALLGERGRLADREAAIGRLHTTLVSLRLQSDAVQIPKGFGPLADGYEKLRMGREELAGRRKILDSILTRMDDDAKHIYDEFNVLAGLDTKLRETEGQLTVCDRCGQALTPEAKARLLDG